MVWLQSCLQLILTDFLLLEPQSSHAGTYSPQRPRRSLSRMLLSLPLIDQLLFPQGSFHNDGIPQHAQFTSQPPHAIIQHLVSWHNIFSCVVIRFQHLLWVVSFYFHSIIIPQGQRVCVASLYRQGWPQTHRDPSVFASKGWDWRRVPSPLVVYYFCL